MRNPAPIALFAYKRPDHLRRTLEALQECKGFAESELHIFCDGPRSPAEMPLVEQVRQIASTFAGRTELHFAESNQGLANSIVRGVNLLTERHGRAIVVEDDLVVSREFLDYLNSALERYVDHPRVMHISAYMYPIPSTERRTEAVFLPTIGSWGWATWRRARMQFEPVPADWRNAIEDRSVRREFDLGGAADFSSMLRAQMKGRIDSWVIRWYWTVFKANGLVLYPPRSLVVNKGFDSSGTHGSRYTARVLGRSELQELGPISFPDEIELTRDALLEVEDLLRQIFGGRTRRLMRNFLSHVRYARRRLLERRET